MFGYVRPLTPELKVRELEVYKAAYCGLCHALGKQYGLAARFFLGYDFVFLSMLLSVDGSLKTCFRRCPVSLRKKRCLVSGTAKISASCGVILAYHKLRDDAEDESFPRRTVARIASMALSRPYRRAAQDFPAFESTVTEQLFKLRSIETDVSRPLDECADAFASLLSSAARHERDPKRGRVIQTLLYHIGRWIYLADARDDLVSDARNGRFNAVSSRWSDMTPDERDARLRRTMDNSLNLAASALELLDEHACSDILRNIIYLGLPSVQDAVFNGTYRARARALNRG